MNIGKEARSLQVQEMETHSEPGRAGRKEVEGEVPSQVCSQEGTCSPACGKPSPESTGHC